MIYLGSPYFDESPVIRWERRDAAGRVAADLIRRGLTVFSPIVHCHEISTIHNLPTDFQFWRPYCLHMLDLAEQFYILELDGWQESKGLTAEALHWKRTRPGEPIIYITEDTKTSSVHDA